VIIHGNLRVGQAILIAMRRKVSIAEAKNNLPALVHEAEDHPVMIERRAYLYDTVVPTTLVLPYDARAAEVHGKERARLEGLGRPPAFADAQIAAIAIVNRLVLVTANVKDFARFEGLAVESWFEAERE
jgi:hypothetical protein